MRDAKKVLEILTDLIPPAKGKRHNITLTDEDDLQLTLSYRESWLPILFTEDDLTKLVHELVKDIKSEISKHEKEGFYYYKPRAPEKLPPTSITLRDITIDLSDDALNDLL